MATYQLVCTALAGCRRRRSPTRRSMVNAFRPLRRSKTIFGGACCLTQISPKVSFSFFRRSIARYSKDPDSRVATQTNKQTNNQPTNPQRDRWQCIKLLEESVTGQNPNFPIKSDLRSTQTRISTAGCHGRNVSPAFPPLSIRSGRFCFQKRVGILFDSELSNRRP